MRAVVLYHPKSEHEGIVQDYVHEFKRFKGKELELLSLETREGAELAKLYDVVRYPAILIIGPDGALQKVWEAPMLPLMNEVDGYVYDYDKAFATAEILSS